MKELVIAFVVLALIGSGVYYEYSLLQQINAEVTRAGLGGITFSSATVTFDLRITNPAHIPVFVDGILVDLSIAGKPVARVNDTTAFELPAQGEALKTLPLTIRLADLGLAGIESFRRGELEWQIDGAADLRVLGFPHTQTFAFNNTKV